MSAPPLPQNPDAERALLGAVLLEPHHLAEVRALVPGPEAFGGERHAQLWAVLGAVADSGKPIDGVLIHSEAERRGWWAPWGAASFLADLIAACPAPSRAKHYAAEVARVYRQRRAYLVAHRLAEKLAGNGQTGASDAVVAALGELSALVPGAGRPTTCRREGYAPFPAHLLPVALAQFVQGYSGALGCDPAMVGLPALATVAAAIGTTRAIELSATWREFPIVWGAVVARSGSLKSPALDCAVAPLRDAQRAGLAEYVAASEAAGRSPGERRPEPPPRYVVSEVTLEALGPILERNPRGLLVARDELACWVNGFDQYRARGRGADAAAWCELHQARPLLIDRKSGERRTIYAPRAAVSVTGTIQPGTLAAALTPAFWENGLAARLLLVQPPERVKRWGRRSPPPGVGEAYRRLIDHLLALRHADGEHGPEPVALPLTPDADGSWATWYNAHAARQADTADDREAALLAKMEAYAARFALLVAVADDPLARTVSQDAVERGTALADWFAGEGERVYGLLAETDAHRERRRLVEWIEGRGGRVTPRDLTRGPRPFRGDPEAAERALAGLVAAGLGRWERQAEPDGGRPTLAFALRGDGDETPANPEKNEVSSPSPPLGEGVLSPTTEAGDGGDSADDRPPDHLLEQAAAGAALDGEVPL